MSPQSASPNIKLAMGGKNFEVRGSFLHDIVAEESTLVKNP